MSISWIIQSLLQYSLTNSSAKLSQKNRGTSLNSGAGDLLYQQCQARPAVRILSHHFIYLCNASGSLALPPDTPDLPKHFDPMVIRVMRWRFSVLCSISLLVFCVMPSPLVAGHNKIAVSIETIRVTQTSKMNNEYFMHCRHNGRRRKRKGAYVDSRQSYIWSYCISIVHF